MNIISVGNYDVDSYNKMVDVVMMMMMMLKLLVIGKSFYEIHIKLDSHRGYMR